MVGDGEGGKKRQGLVGWDLIINVLFLSQCCVVVGNVNKRGVKKKEMHCNPDVSCGSGKESVF